MKILVAPQEFKGSISALSAAEAAKTGILRVFPQAEVVLCPVADGGDGTLETLVEVSGGEVRVCSVQNPIGETIQAQWGAMGDGVTAVIEMARTSGLALLSLAERDPLNASTYGLGQAISEALDEGFRKFIVGIGGSATNDAGAGMAQALGANLLDGHGNTIKFGGAALANLQKVDISNMDSRIKDSKFLVACDVSNPLTGAEGASAVYGPQKGATPEVVRKLDEALTHYAKIVETNLGVDIKSYPGAGAAGGLGAGLIIFANAQILSGIDLICDTLDFNSQLEDVDLIITGEGAVDSSTAYNKAPVGIARRAKARGIPVLLLAGSLGEGYEAVYDHGINAVVCIADRPMSMRDSLIRSHELLANAVNRSLRLLGLTATQ